MAFAFFLLLPAVLSEEVATPASLLQPRNFNHHPYLNLIEPTKQGPVLFPNDGPPRPRTPLIVTSRPLLESIARSDLNNSIAEQSQVNRVSFKPSFLARVKDYRPFIYPVPTITPFSNYDEPPYADVLKKARVHALGKEDRYYSDYEEQTILPPIYKALADHAKQKVLKIQRNNQPHYDYHTKDHNYLQHRSQDETVNEDDQTKNYAFSYTVKDHETGDDFSHKQHSSGSATNGEYRVRLPDGRMQIVSYTADENGYKADVRYDDEDAGSGNRIDNNAFDVKRNINYRNDNRNHYNDVKHDDYNNEYRVNSERNFKIDDKKLKTNDYYSQYPDSSKEYYNDDLSTEYESKNYDYEPHKSKFTVFNDKANANFKTKYAATTVKPSYEELKDLLVNKDVYSTVQPSYFTRNPVVINVPSTTPAPNFDVTTEHVVLIGGNKPVRYTSIVNSVPVTPAPIFPNKFIVSSTPRSYLVSTIAGLRNKINVTQKPILSQNFIDRINKYLSFTNVRS
ncbi:uncharacterized protein LOC106140435 [Amyelois transitella]|uniref:uncharacterized protein LOC106140435 n=1 Tax=Amyelois transitella TaxID=680683 RepID=UPI002990362F|nr:uncharacterized protein LOC106140435 [Amyelois transitella]